MDATRLDAARRSPHFVGWLGDRAVEVVLVTDDGLARAAEVRDAVTDDLVASTERGDGVRVLIRGNGPDPYRDVVVTPGGFDGERLYAIEWVA